MCARIAQPLTIPFLKELGYINDSINESAFDSHADRTASYRILSTKGMMPSKADECGTLTVSRKNENNAVVFTAEEQLFDCGRKYILKAVNKCIDDDARTPISGSEQTVFGSDTEIDGRIEGSESFKYERPDFSITVNGYSKIRRADAPITRWAIMDIVQNLDFENSRPLNFTFIESADIHKAGHSIYFHQKVFFSNRGGQDVPLYTFVQIGQGIIPTEYWVDQNHGLIAIINSGRMYIADDLAVKS